MSGEPEKPSKARLFVAIDPPPLVCERIAAWQEAEAAAALRPVRPEALHMTLAFLGWVGEQRVEDAADAVTAIEPRAVAVRLERDPRGLPKPSRPRLYAIGADSPAAAGLQSEVSAALAAAGLYEPESQPFWPHLTVFRVRQRRGRPVRVKRAPQPLPEGAERAFGAVRLALYRSFTRPEGAEYVRIVDVELPQPRGPEAEAEER